MEQLYIDENGNLQYRKPVNNNTGISTMYDTVYDYYNNYNNMFVPTSEIIVGLDDKAKTIPTIPNNFNQTIPNNFNQTADIMQQAPLKDLGFDTSYGVANEDDEEQEFLPEQERSGIEKLLQYLPFGEKSVLRQLTNFLPQQDPRATGIKNFYRPYEGLTSTGSIASGIMKGYNPVSGGFLNMISGGRFGQPTNYGLAGAMQRRIENILGRKAAQTDASRSKVAELRNLQLAEMQDRSDRGESLGSIGRSTFTGPGMAFEKQQGTTTGKGTANERNYGGR